MKSVLLDTTYVGQIADHRSSRPTEIRRWLAGLFDHSVSVFISDASHYEARRELIRIGSNKSVDELDALPQGLITPLAVSKADWQLAAELWAAAENSGQRVADPKELNVDVILAAQARRCNAIIATENLGHLARFTTALRWDEITIDKLRS